MRFCPSSVPTPSCGWAVVRARRWWLVFLLTLAVLPAVATLLAVLTLALPMEGYTRPQWTYAAKDALVNFGNRHLSFLADWNGPFINRITYVGSADTVDLSSAGPLNYTGDSWEALEDGVYEEYANALETGGAPSPLLFPACAATLMLRTVGVPARYVSGFTADLVSGKTVNFPDFAAHAWVEIYLDGYRCLNRLKKWGGTVDENALELARKARFSQHNLTEEERQTMLGFFDGERARLLSALSPMKRLAFRYLWGRPEQTPSEEEAPHDHP